MKAKLIEIFGWYGALAILGAYALVSLGQLPTDSFGYQFLNATGAIGMVMVSLHRKAYQPAVLNIIWVVVAIVALVRIFVR